MSQEIFYYQRV